MTMNALSITTIKVFKLYSSDNAVVFFVNEDAMSFM